MVVGVSEYMSNLPSHSYDHVYDFCMIKIYYKIIWVQCSMYLYLFQQKNDFNASSCIYFNISSK